jgi:hypothetical protein
MATGVFLDAEATQALFGETVVGASIDGTGRLVLTMGDASTVVIGYVRNHHELLNLEDDDHEQYALADGTRGDFATTDQGDKADAARVNLVTLSDVVEFLGGSGTVAENFLITNDDTDTTDWPNRWSMQYRDNDTTATPRNVFALNEYGEARLASAKHNTVALRVFNEENPLNHTGARSTTVPIIELMDNRTDRNHLWGVYSAGQIKIQAGQIPVAYTIVLGPSDTVPTGTPAGTVIVRTT